MPFFPDLEPPKPLDQDLKWADQLHQLVVSAFGVTKGWSRKSWAHQFRLLRGDIGGDCAKVDKYLMWYTAHAKDDGVPPIRSAKAFRRHFQDWLTDCVTRDEKRNPQVEISADTKDLISKLTNFHWTNGSAEKLSIAVQLSLNNYTTFIKNLKSWMNSAKPGKIINGGDPSVKAYNFAKYVIDKLAVNDKDFIYRWFKAVFDSVKKWKKWSGNLISYVFTPDHKLFKAMGIGWSQKYGGSVDYWFLLMEKVNAYRTT